MTAHSITILSELKMSFGLYAGMKARFPSIATLLKALPNVQRFLNQSINQYIYNAPWYRELCELVIGTRVAGQGRK